MMFTKKNSIISSEEIQKRLDLLLSIKVLISQNLEELFEALNKDLKRHALESSISEIIVIQEEIKLFIKFLRKWTKPKRVPTPLSMFPSESMTVLEPLGKVLIISPWNFPFHLSLVPAIGALAAGNSVVIKPSELAPHSSKLLTKLINNTLSNPLLKVEEGGQDKVESLLSDMSFDKIFFTGSYSKGKAVLQVAAKQLTPVTLELGGKNPLVIAQDANLKLINRIVWGKLLNAGQACLSPDYALVHTDKVEEFVNCLKTELNKFYGDQPLRSPSLSGIINNNHYERLCLVLKNHKDKIIHGGEVDRNNLKIAPSLLLINAQDYAIDDEIFGPILPIISYTNEQEILSFIKRYPNPLACYVYSNSEETINTISREVKCGAISINDCLMHGANPNLPFGGVGESGIGKYHGYHSLICFSNEKTIYKKGRWGDIPLKFPPYTSKKLFWLKKLLNL